MTSRGNRRQILFINDLDRELFLGLLATISALRGWKCRGYCLMPNHYHLVLQTPNADLSAGMQRLNSEYAQCCNYFHGTDGHLFQGRFHAVLVESDWHLAELSRYLALNPVRAGLAATAREWPWSSYVAIAEDRPPPPFLAVESILAFFGRDRETARRSFLDFVDGGSPVADRAVTP